jgi:PAS domain S-box-containing protein
MVTWAYDLQGGIVTRSDNATELLGAGSGTFVEIVNSIRPEDRGRVLEAVARSLGTGKGFEIEYRTPSPAGGDRWLRSRGQLLRRPYAVDRHLIGVTLDVTSEKEAALERDESSEAVASLNARLHALRKVAGEFVWRASPDGRCIGDGSSWRAFTGQSREESDGWGWLGAVHPSDRQRIRNSVTQLFDSHKPGSYEFRLRSRSGHYRWVLSRAVPVLGPDGEPLEWLGSCTELRVPDAADDLGTRRNSQNDAFAMTGAQTRAARALLRWSIRDLAQRSGVSHSTIRRIEAEEGLSSSRDERMLRRVRSTLEEAGIFITLLPDGTSGVGLTSKPEAQLRNNQ